MKKIGILVVVLVMLFLQASAHAISISGAGGSGDKVSIIGDLKVDEKVFGDVVVIGGNADVQNDVNGDLVVVMGDVTINAKVSGDVVSVFGNVKLTDKAEVRGDMVSVGTMERAEGALIYGQDTVINIGDIGIGDFKIGILALIKFTLLMVSLFFVLLLGFPVLAIWSKRAKNIEVSIENNIGKKIAIGLLGFISSILILILLCWTVAVPILYSIFMLFAKVSASILLGKVAFKLFNAKANMYLEFIIGLMLIAVTSICLTIFIPQENFFIGIIPSLVFDALVNSIGIGILIDSAFGKERATAVREI